jgi:hypothetical protein
MSRFTQSKECTSIRLLSGGGVLTLLGESSVDMQYEDGESAGKKSRGIVPGIEIGVVFFCFRLGDSMLVRLLCACLPARWFAMAFAFF